MMLLSLLLFVGTTKAEWRPVEGPTQHQVASSRAILDPDHCNLYKVVMHQENYYQYIQYKAHVPDMKEFTLCTWHKIYNHSTDHPLFSYALKDQPREIVSWISNKDRSSFYQLTIGGHTIYRLNYPMKKFKWYHSCQSWNGKTGEWQLWIDSERVGRGFYNILVGKKIKGGGIAMTGQEQQQYGGGFGNGLKPSKGFIGEVTLVHMYKAALTAGKAYNNHKHHHAHKFHHEGYAEEVSQTLGPEAPQPPPPEAGTEFPFLMNMQLIPRLPVEELNVIRQQQELQRMQLMQQQQKQNGDLFFPFSSSFSRLFKRENSNDTKDEAPKQKRTADFGVFPGVDLSSIYTNDAGFSLGEGVIPFQNIPTFDVSSSVSSDEQQQEIEKEPPKKWNEPAEWEVRSIMSLCSGCGEDPFRKANVLSWRETSKKLYAGALYVPAKQMCHNF